MNTRCRALITGFAIMDRLRLKLTQSGATPSNVPTAEFVDIFYPNIQVHRVIPATHKKCSYFMAGLEQLIATTTSGARALIPHPYSIRTTNSTNTLQQLLRRLNTCDVRWGLWFVYILFYRRRKRRNKKHYNMQWQSGQREQWFLYTEPHCSSQRCAFHMHKLAGGGHQRATLIPKYALFGAASA